MLRKKMRGDSSALRSAYLEMMIDTAGASKREIMLSGPVSCLEYGVTAGRSVEDGTLPVFDQ